MVILRNNNNHINEWFKSWLLMVNMTYPYVMINLVVDLPLWKYEVVSWDDQLPNWMEKQHSCSKPPNSYGSTIRADADYVTNGTFNCWCAADAQTESESFWVTSENPMVQTHGIKFPHFPKPVPHVPTIVQSPAQPASNFTGSKGS